MVNEPGAADLAARIARRRREHDDPAESRIRDHPFEVVEHVSRHRRVPAHVLQADIADAWLILDLLAAQVDEERKRLIEAGHTPRPDGAGLTYTQLAPLVGQASKAGVEALRRRLEAAVAHLPKDTKAARAYARDNRATPTELLAAAAVPSVAVVRTLADLRAQVPAEPEVLRSELDDLVDELEAMPSGGEPTNMFIVNVSWLVKQLYGRPLPVDLRAAVDAAVDRLGLTIRTPAGVEPGASESVSHLARWSGRA